MAIHSDTYYRGLAEEQVRAAGIMEPPVTLQAVADRLGVPVRAAALPPFFQAALIDEDGLPTILINTALPRVDVRRAFGHVIGHMLEVLADEEAAYPKQSGDHGAADLLSSALVMPDYLVVDQARKWFNDHRYLAGLFGVSEDDMLDKMVELGLIQQRGIRWDY